jgi:hypothetical protein
MRIAAVDRDDATVFGESGVRGTEQASALWKFFAIAVAVVLVRLAPMLHNGIDYALPGIVHLTPAERAEGGATPWRQLAIHNDSFEYLQLAEGIEQGCGFARLIGGRCQDAEILRTPGYPMFLAMFPTTRWALAAQNIASGVVCLLLAICINARWGTAPALAAEVLVAIDAPSFVLVNQVMSESMFGMVVLVATMLPLIAIRYSRYATILAIVSGLAAGIAVMIRPIGLLLPIFTPVPFLFMADREWRPKIATAAIALAIPAVTVCGWIARNYAVAGYPRLSTIGSINLYFYRAADVVARARGEELGTVQDEFAERIRVPFRSVYEKQSAEQARQLEQLALPILLAHPFQVAAMTAESALYMAVSPMRAQLGHVIGLPVGPPRLGLSAGAPSATKTFAVLHQLESTPELATLEIFQILTIAVLWVGMVRAILRWRVASIEYRVWSAYLIALAILLLVLAAGGEADVRFRVPAVPLMAAAAALGYFARDFPLLGQTDSRRVKHHA